MSDLHPSQGTDQPTDEESLDSVVPASKRGFFGHPWGLANLAGVEMWERFSFYGMQAILAFYIYYSVQQGGLGLPEAAATSIVGAYGGTVYLSAIIGAWVADRLIGAERAVLIASIVIMCGHISLAVLPGLLGLGVGLVLIALGSGTLKTTTSSVLGDMYAHNDPTRDAAFSIYYMGVNLGALVGPLLTSALWGWRGFHWGFGLAAVGMAIGLIQYALMRRHTISDVGKPAPNPLPKKHRGYLLIGVLAAAALLAVLAGTGVLRAERLSGIVVAATLLAAVALFGVILTSNRITETERSRVVAFIPMFIASAVFWSLFQQQFGVVAIYADQRLNREVFGFTLPPSLVNSINPLFVIIFAGVFAAIWTRLGTRQPSSPLKFAMGTVMMGIAFLAFLPWSGGGANSTPLYAIVLILFLFTVAELCLSPVGQSLATKLAPKAFHTQMIALFFLSIAVGSAGAGALGGYYDPTNERPYFLLIGGASIAVGIVVAVLSKWISKKMIDVH
ncbi:MFS transporter [Enemella evansiae]|uniref:MFS transporter n=1 Tax=Enemella evansiae TaxID=2016499 RepID=A0A255FYK9_9ACTN|nr:oligopeptide:H+ symporter [Enemella evansiae]OYO08778.1 MFS transporter [Enemella evansiae]